MSPALLLLLLLGLASAGPPVIRLLDPGGGAPILEGSNVTLECLSEEPGEGEARLSFQKYEQRLQAWLSLEGAARLPAWFYGVSVRLEAERLLLSIGGAQARHSGAYRCLASANATGNSSAASVSAEFDLRVEYLHGVSLTREDSWCATVGNSEPLHEGQDMKLRCWADASQEPLYEWSREGQDWVVASSSLVLRRPGRGQAGTYTCRARHPSLAQLQRSRSLRLVITEKPPLWAATHGLALAVAVPTSMLLLLLAAFSLLIIIRHRAAAKAKAPREEEPGQRSPIYKASLESVPSTTGDTQPLVM